MKDKKAIGILLAFIGFLLVGCSPISSGTITAKEIEPPTVTVVCSLIGKVTVCNPVPDDQDWRFDIKSEDDEGYVYVTPEEYEQYEVGDYYESKEE